MISKTTRNKSQETNSPSNSSKPGKATTMAELMRGVKTAFVTVKRGEIIKGKIKKITPSEILVNIDAKTDALVLEKDRRIAKFLTSMLKVGDDVQVQVLNPESDLGYPVVSLRRFLDSLMWEKLAVFQKDKKPLSAQISGKTSGGYLVTLENGTSGFLPNSQTASFDVNQDHSGEKVDVYVIELNRENRKVIFSQKPSLTSDDFKKIVKDLKVGQTVEGTVSHITSFGMFVAIPAGGQTVDGLVHISEISWEKVSDVSSLFSTGKKIQALIISIDSGSKRVDLSIKRLTRDPFEEKLSEFKADQKVSGTVAKVLSSGIEVELADGIQGFIRKEKIPPNVSYKEGESINATVSEVDKRKHRVTLVPILLRKSVGYR